MNNEVSISRLAIILKKGEQLNPSKPIEENPVARCYIKNIRDMKGSYTYEEACQLLGITPEKLREIYNQYDIPTFANSVGTPIMTCYDFLTINNILYREQSWSHTESDPCS